MVAFGRDQEAPGSILLHGGRKRAGAGVAESAGPRRPAHRRPGHRHRRVRLAGRHAGCRSLGKGLYEIRSDLTKGRIARVIFCVTGQRMVLLHGFIKKTQKTPKKELDLTLRRMKEVTS